jgi:hypothetical protein
LKHKKRLRKFWHETKNTTHKLAVHWLTQTIHTMNHRKVLEWWDTERSNCQITPPTTWCIAKSLMKMYEPQVKVR